MSLTEAPAGMTQAPMQFTFKVYRDCDVWRLRKVVIQIHHPCMAPLPIDRTRMFGGPFFVKRLSRRMTRMAERARIMAMAHGYIAKVAAKE